MRGPDSRLSSRLASRLSGWAMYWPRITPAASASQPGAVRSALHIDRARHLVIVINSAAEKPTDRAAGQARQDFIAAVNVAVDAEK